MITVELNEYDSQDAHLDYVTFNHRLEKEIRQRFEDGDFEIQIIGFAKPLSAELARFKAPTELQPCWSSVCWRCC